MSPAQASGAAAEIWGLRPCSSPRCQKQMGMKLLESIPELSVLILIVILGPSRGSGKAWPRELTKTTVDFKTGTWMQDDVRWFSSFLWFGVGGRPCSNFLASVELHGIATAADNLGLWVISRQKRTRLVFVPRLLIGSNPSPKDQPKRVRPRNYRISNSRWVPFSCPLVWSRSSCLGYRLWDAIPDQIKDSGLRHY